MFHHCSLRLLIVRLVGCGVGGVWSSMSRQVRVLLEVVLLGGQHRQQRVHGGEGATNIACFVVFFYGWSHLVLCQIKQDPKKCWVGQEFF
jgi:hypothetical protein